jgi:hypothetical protein
VAYRPYPNADRARRQLDRHVHYVDVPRVTISPAVAAVFASLGEAVRGIRAPRTFPAAREN